MHLTNLSAYPPPKIEEYVGKEALYLLQNDLEGCGGLAATAAYTEAFRLITQFGVNDKALIVRISAARCLKAFANAVGPGLGVLELDAAANLCVKVQPKGKGQFPLAKKLGGGLHKHLVFPFVKGVKVGEAVGSGRVATGRRVRRTTTMREGTTLRG
ncbi:hypothetical protein Cgig2_011725 [Carnegiea gigantea]|uniref:Uncharacterized protein n=1 Tax=Carnegiea gigantea TaxID=171969 RepID=A0A9Q1QJB7_9CARY|nr:hypothetical protein Cgig2_011725 [Carnegiea gigantea]